MTVANPWVLRKFKKKLQDTSKSVHQDKTSNFEKNCPRGFFENT